MKLTGRQKFFFGLLAAGVVALGVDRAFFEGGPRRAAAASVAEAPAAGSPADAAAPATANGVLDRVADRLRAIPLDPSEVPDGFATPPAWHAAAHPVVAAAVVDHSGIDFAAKHKLSAVLCRGGGGEAIVDGVTIRRGQRFDGFVLVGVYSRRVRFECGNIGVDLALAP